MSSNSSYGSKAYDVFGTVLWRRRTKDLRMARARRDIFLLRPIGHLIFGKKGPATDRLRHTNRAVFDHLITDRKKNKTDQRFLRQ